MKIIIKSDGKRIYIPVPLWVIKIGCRISTSGLVKKYAGPDAMKYIDAIDTRELCKCIGTLKKYKGLHLVDVESKNGDIVQIII